MRYTLVLARLCLFFGMASAQTAQSIVGVWHNDSFGFQMTMILNADGSGEFDGEPMTYNLSGNQIVITESGFSTTYSFSVNGDGFALSGGDLDGPLAFQRSASQSAPTPVVSKPNASIVTSPSDQNLLGIWSGHGETIEFDKGGQCKYLGQTYAYQVLGSQILLTTQQGQVSFGYQIQGDNLTLTGNNQKIVYSRGNATPAVRESGGGSVAEELVGSWCDMSTSSSYSGGSSYSRCIILRGDGTYSYHAKGSVSVNTGDLSGGAASQSDDSGTWRVQGDRIFYRSNSGQTGSYQLRKVNHPKTGDPMIVLDGESYVTKYQKAPWR